MREHIPTHKWFASRQRSAINVTSETRSTGPFAHTLSRISCSQIDLSRLLEPPAIRQTFCINFPERSLTSRGSGHATKCCQCSTGKQNWRQSHAIKLHSLSQRDLPNSAGFYRTVDSSCTHETSGVILSFSGNHYFGEFSGSFQAALISQLHHDIMFANVNPRWQKSDHGNQA